MVPGGREGQQYKSFEIFSRNLWPKKCQIYFKRWSNNKAILKNCLFAVTQLIFFTVGRLFFVLKTTFSITIDAETASIWLWRILKFQNCYNYPVICSNSISKVFSGHTEFLNLNLNIKQSKNWKPTPWS